MSFNNREEMNTSKKPVLIGCAFLNRPNQLQSGGWASLAGRDPFKFTTLESLQCEGPLWVVSTPEKSFLTENGAAYPFLRHSGFLPTPSTSIAEEVSQNASAQENMGTSAQHVAEILTRVLEFADSIAPVSSLLLRSKSPARTMTSAIQMLMAPPLRSDPMPLELTGAMQSLFSPSSPLGSSNSNDIAIRIPANRILLAETVLSTGVPGYSWSAVPLVEYPNVLSWAIGDNKPIIAKVSVKGPLPKIKSNAPLMGHLTRGAVRWMALPEIITLSKIVEMRAEIVFLSNELVPPSASLRIPPPAFAPAAMASISAGLFAEAYLHAASSPSLGGAKADDEDIQHHQPYSVRAAWLAAVTRSFMVQEALALSSAGFSVIGYGPTHVLVSVSMRNLRNLRKAIGASKLLSYPAGMRFHEERMNASIEGRDISSPDGED